MSHTDVTPSAQSAVESMATVPIAEDLLARILEPYSYKGCRYLIDAEFKAANDAVLAYGNFRIDDSAYIRSTGHFNAVELILCFNQLAYCAFAQGVVNDDISAFRGWSIADYCEHQLSSMLIKSASSRFRRPINPRAFSARLLCQDLRIVDQKSRYLLVPSTVEFWDEDGGAASGEVELVALNIP